MRKLSMVLIIGGWVSILFAIISRMMMRELFWCHLQSRSFGAFAAILFLSSIAINTLEKK